MLVMVPERRGPPKGPGRRLTPGWRRRELLGVRAPARRSGPAAAERARHRGPPLCGLRSLLERRGTDLRLVITSRQARDALATAAEHRLGPDVVHDCARAAI